MKITLDCPYARHNSDMQVMCSRDGGPCAHQYFKSCKGWWVLSPSAAGCPLRKGAVDR